MHELSNAHDSQEIVSTIACMHQTWGLETDDHCLNLAALIVWLSLGHVHMRSLDPAIVGVTVNT